MDYFSDENTLDGLRRKFYDRRKETELLDDCIGEALTKRAVPVTVALSGATYFAIKEGFLKNNGIFGLMRKNFLCMFIGFGASLIGIQSDYNDKLTTYYSSHRYQELRNLLLEWKDEKRKKNASKPFVKPNHLNLDLERPHFIGIDNRRPKETNQNVEQTYPHKITYEQLKRKNREQYALKHNKLVDY